MKPIPWLWTVSMRYPELWRADKALLSQHLAAHPDAATSPEPGQATFGQANAEEHVKVGAIRTFLNSTGTACYANSAIACLAWMTLLSNAVDTCFWKHGFELMRNVTMYSCTPIDLTKHRPFLWLLVGNGVLSEQALLRHQDAREFATSLLNLVKPEFLNCEWVTKPGLCRAVTQAGQLILVIDRPLDTHGPSESRMCHQRVDIPTNLIHFPCFNNTG